MNFPSTGWLFALNVFEKLSEKQKEREKGVWKTEMNCKKMFFWLKKFERPHKKSEDLISAKNSSKKSRKTNFCQKSTAKDLFAENSWIFCQKEFLARFLQEILQEITFQQKI